MRQRPRSPGKVGEAPRQLRLALGALGAAVPAPCRGLDRRSSEGPFLTQTSMYSNHTMTLAPASAYSPGEKVAKGRVRASSLPSGTDRTGATSCGQRRARGQKIHACASSLLYAPSTNTARGRLLARGTFRGGQRRAQDYGAAEQSSDASHASSSNGHQQSFAVRYEAAFLS